MALTERTSIDTSRHSLEVKSDTYDPRSISSLQNDANGVYTAKPLPITGSPTASTHDERSGTIQNGKARTSIEDTEKEKEKDKSAGKKVQKMLKNRVHKEQQRISTIGRKIGHGVGRQRGGLTLRRTTSTPSKEPSILLRIIADLSFLDRFSRPIQSTGNRSGVVPSLFYSFPSSQPLRFDQRTRPSRIASPISSPNGKSSREKGAVKEGTETPQRTLANERRKFPAIGENRASARRYTGGGGQG